MTCHTKRHDTNGAYRRGCRCPQAREAYRLYRKRRREGRSTPQLVNSLGTARRLQALAAIGWSAAKLATELGWDSHCTVSNLQQRRRAKVTLATATLVADVYERLSMTPGGSKRARLFAARKGWPAPLAWDDDIDEPTARPAGAVTVAVVDTVAVERAVRGDRRPDEVLPRAERRAAVLRCRELDMPTHEIARRVGVSTRTVDRIGGPSTPDLSAA